VRLKVRCGDCGKAIQKFGPGWATTGGKNLCRSCADEYCRPRSDYVVSPSETIKALKNRVRLLEAFIQNSHEAFECASGAIEDRDRQIEELTRQLDTTASPRPEGPQEGSKSRSGAQE
jgi:hypothetical protein